MHILSKFLATNWGSRIGVRIRGFLNGVGLDIRHFSRTDLPQYYYTIYDQVKNYTMTSPDRIFSLIAATEHIVKNNVPGAFVECGVWRGGSAMAYAKTLLQLGVATRELYLYDTFAGMPEPSALDGKLEKKIFKKLQNTASGSQWCFASIYEVKKNLLSCGYPSEKIHFIEGKVEETIPLHSPKSISILRLDTDWHASTLHELIHLYPLLERNGILIIDDYGTWDGCRRATDEFFNKNRISDYMHRIDSSGRLVVKTDFK